MSQQPRSRGLLDRKAWNAITYDYLGLATYGDTSRFYCLTDFQVAWLISNLSYYNWMTRWENQNATQLELDEQQADLELALMSCLQLQPYQIAYLYEQQVGEEITLFNDLYDVGGIPDLNPDTPTDFYSGDASSERLEALCTACNIYVRSYAQNWIAKAQMVLGIVAVFGVLASISIVGGIIAGVLVAGLAFITSIALEAMQDSDALDNVVCCMFDSLTFAVINEANFEASLDGCNFTEGTNEAIIRDIIASDLDQWDNWLSFLNSLGDSYVLAQIGVTSCPCGSFPWEHVFDFLVEDGGWSVLTWGDGWIDGFGWQSQDNNNVQEISFLEIFFADTVITFMEFETWTDGTQSDFGAGGNTATTAKFRLDGVWDQVYYAINNETPINRTIVAYDDDGTTVDQIRFTLNPYLANPNKWYYKRVTLRGIGVNPFD